jgi:hypothetical protein
MYLDVYFSSGSHIWLDHGPAFSRPVAIGPVTLVSGKEQPMTLSSQLTMSLSPVPHQVIMYLSRPA